MNLFCPFLFFFLPSVSNVPFTHTYTHSHQHTHSFPSIWNKNEFIHFFICSYIHRYACVCVAVWYVCVYLCSCLLVKWKCAFPLSTCNVCRTTSVWFCMSVRWWWYMCMCYVLRKLKKVVLLYFVYHQQYRQTHTNTHTHTRIGTHVRTHSNTHMYWHTHKHTHSNG